MTDNFKRMFSQNENLDLHPHNLSNKEYELDLTKNNEIIYNHFLKINKKADDIVKTDEILVFLDQCLGVILYIY
jgi:hypothetical protein